ncbi:MAG: hypothetical protein ACXWJ5_03745 [Xanthobacteraceae bacterium]
MLSQSATAVLATLIGGYVLTLINVRSPDQPQTAAEPAAADQRALTREFVKSLREGHADEDMAEVRPTAVPAPSNETVVDKVGSIEATNRAPTPARKENRLRPDVAATSGVSGTPVSAPVQADTAPALGAPIVLTPSNVAAVGPDSAQLPQPAPPREHATVFSAISTFIGSAANATGDGINFMIDLPGRALGGAKEHITRAPTPAPARQPAVGEAAPPMQFAGS